MQMFDLTMRRQFPHVTRFLETMFRHPTFLGVLQVTVEPPQQAAKYTPGAANPWGSGPHPLSQLLHLAERSRVWTGDPHNQACGKIWPGAS